MRNFSIRRGALGVAIAAMSLVTLAGCEDEVTNRDKGAAEQSEIFSRAIDAEPTYQPTNFLTRQYVNEYMRRMDDVNKTYYVYTLGRNGNVIGYYVAKSRPINECTLLTPPDELYERRSTNGNVVAVTKAPQLDGVYSTGSCEIYFFFDATTDALIELKGVDFQISDQPLDVNADPINVKTD